MKTIKLIAMLSCLSVPLLMDEQVLARGDGSIHRDAHGWLQINSSFTGDTCHIKKGRHVRFYAVDGMVQITALNFDGNQNAHCVATYPSDVFYMDQ